MAEALHHGGIENDVTVDIHWVDSEAVTEENAVQILGGCDGILVPGGFRVSPAEVSASRKVLENS